MSNYIEQMYAFSLYLLLFAFVLWLIPFFLNYELCSSRGRKDDRGMWMVMTFIFSWIATLVLLALPPSVEDDDIL